MLFHIQTLHVVPPAFPPASTEGVDAWRVQVNRAKEVAGCNQWPLCHASTLLEELVEQTWVLALLQCMKILGRGVEDVSLWAGSPWQHGSSEAAGFGSHPFAKAWQLRHA